MLVQICSCISYRCVLYIWFVFNDTATTEIYTLSLHDALPISELGGWTLVPHSTRSAPPVGPGAGTSGRGPRLGRPTCRTCSAGDRKSTRLNSSHANISYAVFCLKKKKRARITTPGP